MSTGFIFPFFLILKKFIWSLLTFLFLVSCGVMVILGILKFEQLLCIPSYGWRFFHRSYLNYCFTSLISIAYFVFRPETTILSYEVNVIPRLNFPAIFLERIIRSDLPVNLQALACRAERTFGENQNAPVTDTVLVTTSMATSPGIRIDNAISEKDKLSPGDLEDGYATSSFVRVSQSSSELSSNWGVFGKVCNLDRPCIVDEVHLRRFDGLLVTAWLYSYLTWSFVWKSTNVVAVLLIEWSFGFKENGGVHRGVVASITIKASVQEVWNTLTAYESLPE